MRQEVKDAIESACTREAPLKGTVDGEPTRWHTPEYIKQILYKVIRELPEEMSIQELREELE